jgi:adenylate kinase family enzyme
MRSSRFDAGAAARRLASSHRIAVLGCGGTGKSTAAREIAGILGLPLVHLDALHWLPGWQARPEAEWEGLQRELVAKDRWIMDGNYSRTLEIRLRRADAVLFLDLPRRIALWRAFWRSVRLYGRVRPDLGEGCPEHIDVEFLRWIWDFPRRTRGKLVAARDAAPKGQVWLVPRTTRDVRRLLSELRALRASS